MKDVYRPHTINDFVGYTLSQAPHLKAEQKPYDSEGIAQEHREQASERIHKENTMMRLSGNTQEAQKVRKVLQSRRIRK